MKQISLAALILFVGIVLFPGNAHAQSAGVPTTGWVEPIDCPIEVPESVAVECGALNVPENYEDPASPTINLPYILLHSNNPEPLPDPLIYTDGGPGWSSLDSIWGFVNSPILAERNVIVFEQRGNKYAHPSLVCDGSFFWEAAPGNTPCLDSIKAKGVDIAQYNTANIVRDIIALRQALDYEAWNLYGTSFSTSLMLLVMEADPPSVRSVILRSVKPPSETTFDHQADSGLRAIEQMFTDCRADQACSEAYPNLESQFFELVRDLNLSPVKVEVKGADEDETIQLEIDGHTFLDWVVIDNLYRPAFPPFGTAYIPLLIDEVSNGNLAPLETIAKRYWNGSVGESQWSLGLLMAINCQQDLPAAGASRPAADLAASEQLDGFARNANQEKICAAWELPALSPAGAEYVRSDIPALVLAGSYDPVTPPVWSKTTAEQLPNSTYVEFPAQGHNVTINNPCAQKLQADFLHNPAKKLDINCVQGETKPSFILPNELFIAPGLASSGDDISIGNPQGNPWIEALALFSIMLMIVSLIGLFVLAIMRLVRGRRIGAGLSKSAVVAWILAVLLILSALSLPILVTRFNAEYQNANLIHFALGPDRNFIPAVILAWISPAIGLLFVALASLTMWAWLSHRWPLGIRLMTSLVVLATLTMIFLGLRWGLFTILL